MSDTPRTDRETMRDEMDCVDTEFDPYAPSDMVSAEFSRQLERELAEVRAEAAKWKANHDNQVQINRILRDRPDMRERAKLVDELMQQRDMLAEALHKIAGDRGEASAVSLSEAQQIADAALAAVKGGQHE